MATRTVRSSGEPFPTAGRVLGLVVSLLSTSVLALFLMMFAIYTDSYIFVFASAMLQHSIGLNASFRACDSAILICLVCYVTTKSWHLMFSSKSTGADGLQSLYTSFWLKRRYAAQLKVISGSWMTDARQHIIRGTPKKRIRSRLYMFNSLGMISVYVAVVILNFAFRIAKLEDDGKCIIGMKSFAMIPLISFDAVVNVYLTMIFLIPLRNLYSYKNMPRTHANMRLRTVAFRTFCGAVCTLLSSMVYDEALKDVFLWFGQEGADIFRNLCWVCLMSCNCDILFSAAVIQWVTSKDNVGTSTASSTSGVVNGREALGHDSIRVLTPYAAISSTASSPVELSLVATARSSTQAGMHADEATSAGGVIVTTTIERETKLGGGTKSQESPVGIPMGRGYQERCYAGEEACATFQEAYGSRVNITARQP
ncbi:hypothetical protein MAC_06562 [Metarhizium acridum CQMa 102]|uniref:Uncharacterized protein n=1 Tax=Metarhizium acridum (strain CQMa 102) TaxID=655827 RepID=E9E9L4_METAQ|nr:uncharacterized protein MAC_06562 [Metarhizium acridum CQMa 102]EFY87454.1 hypothetical protein MAC_06562 [Metarhizium acridum CQMa 102]